MKCSTSGLVLSAPQLYFAYSTPYCAITITNSPVFVRLALFHDSQSGAKGLGMKLIANHCCHSMFMATTMTPAGISYYTTALLRDL